MNSKRRMLVESGTRLGYLLVLAALLVGCGSASEPQSKGAKEGPGLPESQLDSGQLISEVVLSEADPRDLVPVHWRVSAVSGPREVVIESGRGFCVNGQTPPEYEGVNIREDGHEVYITAFVKRPSPPEGVICRGVGYWQVGTVKLGQDLKPGVKLLDARKTPRVLRWPRS